MDFHNKGHYHIIRKKRVSLLNILDNQKSHIRLTYKEKKMKNILSIILLLSEEALSSYEDKKKRLWFSAFILFVTNIIPLIGIFIFAWNPFYILIFYWVETFVIGVFQTLKFIIEGIASKKITFFLFSILMMLFFLIIYTGTIGTSAFILGYIGLSGFFQIYSDIPSGIEASDKIIERFLSDFSPEVFFSGNISGMIESELIAVIFIIVSQALSFLSFYIAEKRYIPDREGGVLQLVFGLHDRFILYAIAIFGGLALFSFSNDMTSSVVILVLIKTTADLWTHFRREI